MDKNFLPLIIAAKTILNRLSEENKLFISTSGNEMTGYVYIEAEPQHGEGSIEYIAVSKQYRRQGIGKKLADVCCKRIVRSRSNRGNNVNCQRVDESAIKLYQSVGFQVKHELIHFRIDKKEVLL